MFLQSNIKSDTADMEYDVSAVKSGGQLCSHTLTNKLVSLISNKSSAVAQVLFEIHEPGFSF